MDKVLSVAIIGVSSRGGETYGAYMVTKPEHFKIVALCDIRKDRIEKFQDALGVKDEGVFYDEDEFFKERRADLLVVSTQDGDHVRHALKALKVGYHIILEKPISAKKEELFELEEAAKKAGTKILVCHVLRYTVAMNKVKELLDEKSIGTLISIDHLENVAYWHQAHSYVRGNWRRAEETSPMIMAKCCHDLDLLQWFAGSECESISSIGELNYFKKECAPKEAAKRCLDCPLMKKCPYSAYRIYIERWKDAGKPSCWPYSVLTSEKVVTEDILMDAIKNGPYGRCVFYCDNNVVDNQSVNCLFKNGITANLKMTAFDKYSGRFIHFFGTEGEIFFREHEGFIELRRFGEKEDKKWYIKDLTTDLWGHGGGDSRMVDYMYKIITEDLAPEGTSLHASIESHLMALAAEESRLKKGELVKIHK